MLKWTQEPKSEQERRCKEYVRAVYQAQDWLQWRSASLWMTLLAAGATLAALLWGLQTIVASASGGRLLLAMTLWLIPFTALCISSILLQRQAQGRAVVRLRRHHNLVSTTYDDLRAEMLSKYFNSNPRKFVDVASQLKKILELRQFVDLPESASFVRMSYSIYDPGSKPRILALLGVLIALMLAATRGAEVAPDQVFEFFGPLGRAFWILLSLALMLWTLLMMLSFLWGQLERWLERLDRWSSRTSEVQLAMRDLLNLSRA
jgi:hypothetical protein